MNFFTLAYFKKIIGGGGGICSNDFENEYKTDAINLEFVLSISDIQRFENPFSGTYVGKYAIVTMSNNDTYYITESTFVEILSKLK